ncbi:hypothetical protein H1S01_18025 [Heliobacterium chlorum]|uniref:Uncharacterized protein n=1 Tax=Heliobacterium chlorum TaxID=2698 RepID=A0ABR7T6G5_HELCL|nr:hypothetical protein [Heliobacterium chlorum]MBC9786359.1 hypothetical protein [Heliobacterium chlorum]
MRRKPKTCNLKGKSNGNEAVKDCENGKGKGGKGNGKGKGNCNGTNNAIGLDIDWLTRNLSQLKPPAILVILGLLSRSLVVTSLLVNNEQEVQILLTGSLRKKTTLDRVMEQVADQPFGDVLESLLRR